MSRLRFALAVLALGIAATATATPAFADPGCPGIVTTAYDYCASTGRTCDNGGCEYECWSYANDTYHKHCWDMT